MAQDLLKIFAELDADDATEKRKSGIIVIGSGVGIAAHLTRAMVSGFSKDEVLVVTSPHGINRGSLSTEILELMSNTDNQYRYLEFNSEMNFEDIERNYANLNREPIVIDPVDILPQVYKENLSSRKYIEESKYGYVKERPAKMYALTDKQKKKKAKNERRLKRKKS